MEVKKLIRFPGPSATRSNWWNS